MNKVSILIICVLLLNAAAWADSVGWGVGGMRTERRASCAEASGDALVIVIQKQETAGYLLSGTIHNCSENAITFGTIEQNSPYIELSRPTAQPGISGSLFHGKLPLRVLSGDRNEPLYATIEAKSSLNFEIDLEKLGWLEANSSFIGKDSFYDLSRLPFGEYRVRILLSLIRDDTPHDPKKYRSPEFKLRFECTCYQDLEAMGENSVG